MKAALDFLRIAPSYTSSRSRLLVLAATLSMAGVFLTAGLSKIADPRAFALVVHRYQAVPDIFVNPTALFLPWLELISGASLILVPRWRKAAGVLILGMLLVFTGLIVSVIIRGIDLNCGCFSVDPGADAIGWQNVFRNLLFILLTTIALRGAARCPANQ